MRKIVLEWLKENNIFYDNIIFSPEDKINICIENDIDLMIEDKVENINIISQKILSKLKHLVITFHITL